MKEGTLTHPRAMDPEFTVPKVLSVALIGPGEELRQAMAKALAESRRARVVEYDCYPPDPRNLENLLRRDFDVVFIDVDDKPDFSLELVRFISSYSATAVMAYSRMTDQYNVLRCMTAGAREYLSVPLKAGAVVEALDRAIALRSSASRPPMTGRLLVFLGAKGGSGVTTLVCNLAIALAQDADQRTLIIDFARPMGDAALNLGIAANHSTEDALRNIDQLDANSLQSLVAKHRSGISVLAAPSNVPEVEAPKTAIDKLLVLARQVFDNVIVDVGSRTDLMGTALFSEASCIYLVTQAGISELRNSNRLISQFFKEGGPKLEIVLNRYESHPLGAVNDEVITKALGKPFRWKIPDDQGATRMLQNADAGQSLVESSISRISLEMAGSITGTPAPGEAQNGPVSRGYGKSHIESGSNTNESPNIATAAPIFQRPTPTIAWSTPDPITYGQPLSAVQLNATTSVPGTFVYTPGAGYVLPVGSHSLWVTFNSADSQDLPVQGAVIIQVLRATPAISWPAPPVIAFGTAIGATELNAIAIVPGTFEYTPAAGEVLAPGTHTLSVTFTPANTADYTTAHASVEATVGKAIPAIEWAVPDPIPYGTALSAAHLNATASIPGTFNYSPGAGEVLSAGTHTATVIFNPADSTNYAPARATVPVIVIKAKPVVAWPTPDPITYGTALGAEHLNAKASVPGAFEYIPGPGAVLAAGEHSPSVIFHPTDDSNYASAKTAVSLVVRKSTPVVTWPTPNPMVCGTALSSTQLNATATVPGLFEYTPAAGEVPGPGEHRLSATFTPTDRLNHSTVQVAVQLLVSEIPPAVITWETPSPVSYGVPLNAAQLNATSSNEGTFLYAPPAGVVLAPGRHTLSVSFVPSNPANCTAAQATVEFEVTANRAAPAKSDEATGGSSPSQEKRYKTRTYKGAVYVQGDDGQWHLQQK